MNWAVQAGEHKKEILRLRIGLLLGALLIAIFVIADTYLLPLDMQSFYLINRLWLQVPVLIVAIVLSYTRYFYAIKNTIFTVILLVLTFTNYALIYQSWIHYRFAFPYEGTIVYAFYCVFALGIPFKLAFVSAVLSVIGFVGLMLIAPVYGDRVMISSVFVSASLFTCVYAKYRLDRMFDLLALTNKKLSLLSRIDPLSGLLNRRALMLEIEQITSLCRRENIALAVIMFDLDDFKKYNDAFGHQKGDDAIVIQANILRTVFKRHSDILGRYGGEEFMAVVSGLNAEQVTHCCEQVLGEWKKLQLSHAKDATYPIVSCSIGVSITHDVDLLNITLLIKKADEALYEAKKAGKFTYKLSTLSKNSVDSKCENDGL